jgi:CorA-like Mg2+ transporter protein
MPQPLWDAGESFQDRFETLQGDLRYFRDQFTRIAAEIKELQQTIHEHLHLTQNRRNFILTVLAAVYLPLSFATSFFGMNISTAAPPSPQGFFNWTASWIENLPVDTQNSTKALVSTIGSSGTLNHSWKTFAITAAFLLVTLPISSLFFLIHLWRFTGSVSSTLGSGRGSGRGGGEWNRRRLGRNFQKVDGVGRRRKGGWALWRRCIFMLYFRRAVAYT